jgi:hypothetical protein
MQDGGEDGLQFQEDKLQVDAADLPNSFQKVG